MEIGSKSGYPASTLSNFSGHRFVFDGVTIHSMEGFLQSVKFKEEHIQVQVCTLVGYSAKRRGSQKNWKREQKLHWKGVVYEREGPEYQELLDRVYTAMYEQCESFRDALKATGNATLKHSMGKNKESDTVLTIREFCGRLTKLRDHGKL